MLTETQQIAADYVAAHKKSAQEKMIIGLDERTIESFPKELDTIFVNLIAGVYGECRSNEETDDDGNTIEPPTEWEIEIDRFDAAAGHAWIFNFTYAPQ
jgi:hypothetical protein